jgi:ribosome-associated heat shock protein Hsp15
VSDVASPQRQRLDKWLWHARVVKTRTLAQKLVAAGKVRINREKVLAPSAALKAGDVLTIGLRQRVRVMRVVGFSERRGSATQAGALYEDLSLPAAAGAGSEATPGPGPVSAGRPDKRQRRALDKLKKFDD